MTTYGVKLLGPYNAVGYLTKFLEHVESAVAGPTVEVFQKGDIIAQRISWEKDCLSTTGNIIIDERKFECKGEHAKTELALLVSQIFPTNVVLVVFSLGYPSNVLNHATASMYSYNHVAKTEVSEINSFLSKSHEIPQVIFVGLNFSNKNDTSAAYHIKVNSKQISALTEIIPKSIFLEFNPECTEQEFDEFMTQIRNKAPGPKTKSETPEERELRLKMEETFKIAQTGSAEELQASIANSNFLFDAKNQLNNIPYFYFPQNPNSASLFQYLIENTSIPLSHSLFTAFVALPKVDNNVAITLGKRLVDGVSFEPTGEEWNKFFCHLTPRGHTRVKDEKPEISDELLLSLMKLCGPLLVYSIQGSPTNECIYGLMRFAWSQEYMASIKHLYSVFDTPDNFYSLVGIMSVADCVLLEKVSNELRKDGIRENGTPGHLLWRLQPRGIDFVHGRKHNCFGVPSLAHLCIDAMVACRATHIRHQLLNLPPHVSHHLSQHTPDPWSYFEWVRGIPNKKKRAMMLKLLQDLKNSNIPLNTSAGKLDNLRTTVHGYKSRQIHGVGKKIAEGKLTLTFTKKPAEWDLCMDSYGYFFVNTEPVEGWSKEEKDKKAFFLTHGTQMDSVHCPKFFDYLSELGIEKEDAYPILVLIFNWFKYGNNMSEIFYPGRLEPSSWRNGKLGPPEWFKELTYEYGFRKD